MRQPSFDPTPSFSLGQLSRPSFEAASTNGFSLLELMLTVVLVGVLSGIGFANLSRRWESERLQTTSKTLAAWLDERRRQGMAAMEQVGTGACSIEINTSTATLSAESSTIRAATASESKPPGNICRHSAPLELRTITSNTDALTLSVEPANTSRVLFTFRGTSPFNSSSNNETDFTEFKLRLGDHPMARCVRISKPLGLIRLGSARPANASCTYISAY